MTDSLIAGVLDALDAARIREKTVVLVTADHGGKGTKHGGDSPEELEIPWILHGPGVHRGVEIRSTVNTFDTAPTLASVLGVKPPSCWQGRVVREALQSQGSAAR